MAVAPVSFLIDASWLSFGLTTGTPSAPRRTSDFSRWSRWPRWLTLCLRHCRSALRFAAT